MSDASLSTTRESFGVWQPIETAQKSSKSRLVWCPAYQNTYVVSWVIPLDELGFPDATNGFWCHFGNGSRRLNEQPTHWMPLPEPPE